MSTGGKIAVKIIPGDTRMLATDTGVGAEVHRERNFNGH